MPPAHKHHDEPEFEPPQTLDDSSGIRLTFGQAGSLVVAVASVIVFAMLGWFDIRARLERMERLITDTWTVSDERDTWLEFNRINGGAHVLPDAKRIHAENH